MPPTFLLVVIGAIFVAGLLMATAFVGLVILLTRHRGPRGDLLIAAGTFPIAATIWMLAIGTPQPEPKGVLRCLLPNEYEMLILDSLQGAQLYSLSPRFPELLRVETLQVDEKYLLGSKDQGYFLLNLVQAELTNLRTEAELKQAAAKLGIQLNLEPVRGVYQRYRLKRFPYSILASPPILGLAGLCFWTWRVRTRGTILRNEVSTDA